jgi:hypothetical protein
LRRSYEEGEGRRMAVTEAVFRVWHPLTIFRERYVSDLIFRDRKPLIVVEWDASRTTAVNVVQFERRHLHPIDAPKVHYLYDVRIEFPDFG